MLEKEIAELRRRFKNEKNNISRIRGCLVNEKGEIISEFDQTLGLLPPEAAEGLLGVMRKTLTGAVGKNLVDIAFSNDQVVAGSDEHNLLMALRDSELSNDDAVHELFARAIHSLRFEGNFLILLACDKYDVFGYSGSGEREEDAAEVFRYITCSVCPVKLSRPMLSYIAYENAFHAIAANSVVSAPELGFLFPAFDDRTANIYGALFYTKSAADIHAEFIEEIFKTGVPMPAAEQKQSFDDLLGQTVSDDRRYEVVQTVHDRVYDLVEDYKSHEQEEPLRLNKRAISGMLKDCELAPPQLEAFERGFDERFGANAELCPQNLVDVKQFYLQTPDVTIKVNPQRSDLVETRLIDGHRYILIRAEEGVEVNGVTVKITK